MYIVILAGGSGTRFWPLSRQHSPKQLMSVLGGKSMLQRTVERVLPLKPKRLLVVTNALQARETARQLDEYQQAVRIDIVTEPVGRNTAPAIGLAATIIAGHDPAGLMVVLPADHYIADEEGFRDALHAAREPALNGYLVTLGIVPNRPETGYGYIEAEEEMRGGGPYPVRRFVEKPPRDKALEFLTAGNFYWNSGMFVWRADVILDQILAHMPGLAAGLAELTFTADVWAPEDLKPQIARLYQDVAGESIDFGVMEKAENVMVIPTNFGWSDVGSWNALPEVLPGDGNGNLAINTRQLIAIDATGCLVYGSDKIAALIGVSDLVVVDCPDALLICPKERAQDVKKIVEELERQGRKEFL